MLQGFQEKLSVYSTYTVYATLHIHDTVLALVDWCSTHGSDLDTSCICIMAGTYLCLPWFLPLYCDLVTSCIHIMGGDYLCLAWFLPTNCVHVTSLFWDYGGHLKPFSHAVLIIVSWTCHIEYPNYGAHLILFSQGVLTAVSWSRQITYPGLWQSFETF